MKSTKFIYHGLVIKQISYTMKGGISSWLLELIIIWLISDLVRTAFWSSYKNIILLIFQIFTVVRTAFFKVYIKWLTLRIILTTIKLKLEAIIKKSINPKILS